MIGRIVGLGQVVSPDVLSALAPIRFTYGNKRPDSPCCFSPPFGEQICPRTGAELSAFGSVFCGWTRSWTIAVTPTSRE
jgi:hypothetical protein